MLDTLWGGTYPYHDRPSAYNYMKITWNIQSCIYLTLTFP